MVGAEILKTCKLMAGEEVEGKGAVFGEKFSEAAHTLHTRTGFTRVAAMRILGSLRYGRLQRSEGIGSTNAGSVSIYSAEPVEFAIPYVDQRG